MSSFDDKKYVKSKYKTRPSDPILLYRNKKLCNEDSDYL